MFHIRQRLASLVPRDRITQLVTTRVCKPQTKATTTATITTTTTATASAKTSTANTKATKPKSSPVKPKAVPVPQWRLGAAAASSLVSGRALTERARQPLLISNPPVPARAFSTGNRYERRQQQQQQRVNATAAQAPAWKQLLLGAGSAVLLAAIAADVYNQQKAKACGIVGFIGNEPAVPYLMEGLSILQNRGYDSAGVATLHKGDKTGALEINTTKFASLGTNDSVAKLKEAAPTKHAGDMIGISHTRWATHGGKTDENAHPHSDHKDRLALVHNGTIENSAALKAELEAKGIPFRSQTDTEVIVQLIGTYLDEKLPLVDAVKKTLSRLEGTWGICVISKEHPDQIIAARNGSPLVIGMGENRMFVASETSAFSRHTNQYISLSDGEVAVIKANGTDLDLSRVEKAHVEEIALSPAPYPNWTIKEIMEQPEAIARTLNYGGRFTSDGVVKLGGLQDNADLLLGVRNLTIAACGTSLFAGMYGARLMRWLHCFDSVYTIDAAEVVPESLPLNGGGILVISQSGETKDTHRALMHAEAQMMPRFSVVNQVGSLIARSTKCGVYLNAGREHAVASTKAFTTQVAALSLVAGWYAQNRGGGAADAMALIGNGAPGGMVGGNPAPLPKSASAGKSAKSGAASSTAVVPVHGDGKIAGHKNHGGAINISQRRADLIESIHRLPTYTGMTLKTHEQCKQVAAGLKDKEHIFVLGKGFAEPIAYEGALKIKEIGYCHAEGYSGGALKHGPFALLEEGTPVILLILDDQHGELMRVAAAETKARGARNIIITDAPKLADGIADPKDTIVIPSNGPLTALLGVLPLQMIAYEMAMAKKITVDTPRNLAKAVTVD